MDHRKDALKPTRHGHFPQVPGGIQETMTRQQSSQPICVCDDETKRLCVIDKIIPGGKNCVRSNLA